MLKMAIINHAFDYLRTQSDPPEFIAIFDADFAPQRNFLWRTMPLFHDAEVGLGQTAQHFVNKTRFRRTACRPCRAR